MLQVTKDPCGSNPVLGRRFWDYGRNFRPGTGRSNMPQDGEFRGGIDEWVNVSPNPDVAILRVLSG